MSVPPTPTRPTGMRRAQWILPPAALLVERLPSWLDDTDRADVLDAIGCWSSDCSASDLELERFSDPELRRLLTAATVVALLREAGVFVGPVGGSLAGTRLAWVLGLACLEPSEADLPSWRFFSRRVTDRLGAPAAPGLSDAILDSVVGALAFIRIMRTRSPGETSVLCALPTEGLRLHLTEVPALAPLQRAWGEGGGALAQVDLDAAVAAMRPGPALFDLDDAAWRWVRKVRPRTLEELAAARALDRPGPMAAGIADAYLRAAERSMWGPVTRRTRGVLVYQEQISRLLHERSGMPLEDADELRRRLARARPSERRELFARFAQRAIHSGRRPAPWEWFDELSRHAPHAFNRSHAISNAVLTALTAHCHQGASAPLSRDR